MSRSRRRVSIAVSSRSLASASSISERCDFSRVSSSVRSAPDAGRRAVSERGRQAADLVALATALFEELIVLDLDHGPMCLHETVETLDRRQRTLDLLAAVGGVRTGFRVRGEPALVLGDPCLEELLALVEAGIADLELAAAARQEGGACFEVGAGLTPRPRRIGFGLFVGVERRQHRLELGDPGLLRPRRARSARSPIDRAPPTPPGTHGAGRAPERGPRTRP